MNQQLTSKNGGKVKYWKMVDDRMIIGICVVTMKKRKFGGLVGYHGDKPRGKRETHQKSGRKVG